MASEWREFKISELLASSKNAIAMGPFGSRIKAENFVRFGVPVIKGAQLHGTYLNDIEFDFLKDEKADELKTSMAFRGDLVITHRGTIGQVSVIPYNSKYEKYIVSQSQLKITFDKKKINPYFISYFFKTSIGQHRLLANASQVGVPAIAKASTSVKDILIPCPDLKTQNNIVFILKKLDDKIELNHQMNATLEAMAQALFKSWFVDFDPVLDNALAAGNPIPDELQSKATARLALGDARKPLPAEIQALFPSSFVLTEEMGWIPEGWEVKVASDIADISIGKTPPRIEKEWFAEEKNNNVAWVSIKDMGNANVYIEKTSEFLTQAAMDKFNIKLVPKDSVLLSFKLTLGRISICSTNLATNEAIAHFVNPKYNTSPFYIFGYLKSFDFSSLGSTSSIATAINSKIIKSMPFLLPDEKVLLLFATRQKTIFTKLYDLQKQQSILENLRDTLLPKLLSGELRIPDAEKLAAEVL